MRALAIALLLLAACGSPETSDEIRPADPAPIAFDGALVTQAAARIAHGERLTWALGCRGCHGKDLQGHEWINSPDEGVLDASNLTRAIPNYTDAQLKKLLLSGEHPIREYLWDMPSELFQHLSAPDLDALVSYLRTLKPGGKPSPEPVFGPAAKKWIAEGELKPASQRVRETRNLGPIERGPQHELGRYITRVTCAECHGAKLQGSDKNPDLVAVGAYSREEFERLITEGVPTGGRKLKPLMVDVAQNRFTKLTSHERDALYAYLKARAEQPQ